VCDTGTYEVSACSATFDAVCELVDGGVLEDAGADAGAVDDAGVFEDGGAIDGGVTDAGDGGDAAVRDADVPGDASTDVDASIAPTPESGGCGCEVVGATRRSGASGLVWLVFIALLAVRQARRRARR
jgi:hypothetical protein